MLGQALAQCIHACGHTGLELAHCIHMMIRGF